MKPITINPFIKFVVLLMQFILIFLIQDLNILMILLVFNCLGIIIFQWKKLYQVFKFAKFGLFLAIFALTFNYIMTNNMQIAAISSLNLLMRYLLILIASIIYKDCSSNKEIAYVISRVMYCFGLSQNKIYTMILVILNQIMDLRQIALNLYRFERFNNPTTNKLEQIQQIIALLPVYINNVLKQNENFTISLLNKNYDPNIRKINVFLLKKYSKTKLVILLLFISIEIIIWVLLKG